MIPLEQSVCPVDTSVPLEEITIGEALQRAAARRPDAVALVAGASDPAARREWTNAELLAVAGDVARALLADLRRVVCFDDWPAFLATAEPHRELPTVKPGDAVQIQYTSGTTGFPKGALLHHRGLLNNARLMVLRQGARAGQTQVSPMPLFHCAGCAMGVLGSMQAGMRLVLVPQFDPALVLELAETYRADLISGVPTMLIALLEHPDFQRRDLSSVRMLMSGGAVVPPELVRRLEEGLGATFTIVFGMTEASPVMTQTFPGDTPEDKGLSIGKPLPHTEAKVVDPVTGEVVPVGVAGELCVRG